MTDSRLTDLLNREITLHDRTWFGHIVKGHPEITQYRFLVKQAVTRPTEIRHSRSDSNCRLYYGHGLLLLRRESDGRPVGLTIINWWKRFGKGDLPDSIKELEHCIEPWAKKVAA